MLEKTRIIEVENQSKAGIVYISYLEVYPPNPRGQNHFARRKEQAEIRLFPGRDRKNRIRRALDKSTILRRDSVRKRQESTHQRALVRKEKQKNDR